MIQSHERPDGSVIFHEQTNDPNEQTWIRTDTVTEVFDSR